MKKNIIFIIIGIVAVLFTYCEDFLEKNPLDKISNETFWNTEEDVKMGLTGVYQAMYNRSTFDHRRMNRDCMTDIGYAYYNYDDASKDIASGIIESTTGGLVINIYNQCYVGISRCNTFLENIKKAKMDATNKTRYISEVLFLRAMFYFTLTEFYGGVPLHTEPVTIEEAKVKKSSKAEVVAQVLQD